MTRSIISLDGQWGIAEGAHDTVPQDYPSMVPVPGLVDMATPAFEDVGLDSDRRQAFWYRRTFSLDTPLPEFVFLKLRKARYASTIYVNGKQAGTHLPNHTPGTFDVRSLLLEGENDIVVRLGAWRDPNDAPQATPDGRDPECYLAVPGIYDSVELILSDPPYIDLVKVEPDIEAATVRAFVRLQGGEHPTTTDVTCRITETRSGQANGPAAIQSVALAARECREIILELPIDQPHLWSPEDPFLYSLHVETAGDRHDVRFGMRTFTFDAELNQALLNGKPYPIRGTATTLFRFFEDPDRGDKPWREDWVRRLHEQLKAVHWNTVRYSIGFPPDFWYDIADEVGLLVFDEYPLFYIYLGDNQPVVDAATQAELGVAQTGIGLRHLSPEPSTAPPKAPWPAVITADDSLIAEYTAWVETRCNHPSVVLFSANCESRSPETGKAITAVRPLDPQKRPWSNGWNTPLTPSDPYGAHWYVQWNAVMRGETPGVAPLATSRKAVVGYPLAGSVEEMRHQIRTPNKIFDGVPVNYGGNAVLLEEYGWLWLTRDGTPTRLTRPIYAAMTEWPTATAEERQYTRARILAAETEYFRGHRAMAGIVHFCALTSSHDRVFTADHFTDAESLEYEPNFWRYCRDAFAPAAVMIDLWTRDLDGGVLHEIPVNAINDEPHEWSGYLVLQVLTAGESTHILKRAVRIPALGQVRVYFAFTSPIPDGEHQLVAELTNEQGYSVKSWRDIHVTTRPLEVPAWLTSGGTSAAGPHEA